MEDEKIDRTDYVLTENYCDECDQVVHAVFDRDAFFDHRVGVVSCDQCGHKVMPCNECETRTDCGNCPWRNADAAKPMSDEDYLRFLREHEPECYKAVKDEGVYAEVAKRIEAGEKKDGHAEATGVEAVSF